MQSRGSPLSRKLIIAVIAISSFFSILVSLAQIYYSWHQRKLLISSEVDSHVASCLPSLQRSVWYLDQVQASANLQMLEGQTGVGRVEIVLYDGGQVFASFGSIGDANSTLQSYPIKHSVEGRESELGRLDVYIVDKELTPYILKQAVFVFVTNALKGLVLAFILFAVFERFVTRHIRSIVSALYRYDIDNLEMIPKRQVNSRDEIDFMIDALNDMQHAVKRSQEEEIQANKLAHQEVERSVQLAQKVAVAEVTTSVLHDINNILGSITLATFKAKKDLKTKTTQEVLDQLITGIEKNSKLIIGIIHTQQDLAMGVTENWDSISLNEIIDDAILVDNYSLERSGIAIAKSGELHTVIVTKKHVIITVLVNLIKNARESIVSSGKAVRRITIGVELVGTDVSITLKDTGHGATQETLDRVFDRGFTTKLHGHGFGLSGCKLNLQRIAATISMHSEGIGLGAEAVIIHPIDARIAMGDKTTESIMTTKVEDAKIVPIASKRIEK